MIRLAIAASIAFASAASASASEPAAAPAAAPATAAATTDPELKLICRRDLETGSLVKAKKRCHTRSQWAYIDEQNQKLGRNLVDETRGRVTSQ